MPCLTPISIPNKVRDAGSKLVKYMQVPCGKCIGCKQDRSDSWSYRLFCEEQTNRHSLFVTLTYNPESLPLVLDNGKIIRYYEYIKRKTIDDCFPTLYPKDFTDYMKRLRSKLPINGDVKYFMCGEYGSEDGRPHYHFAIFFNDNQPELVEQAIQDCWPFGFTTIDPLIFNRITYLTKYITDTSKFVAQSDLQHQYYNRSSHGLGVDGYFLDSNYYGGAKFTTQLPNGKIINLPRYFRRKFLIDSDFNTQKLLNNNAIYERNIKNTRDRLKQDAVIKLGNQSIERIDKYVDDRLEYSSIERVFKLRNQRKKNL